MSKSHNRSRRNRRRQKNVTPQMVSNHTIEDLLDSKADETPVSEVKG
jgi:hypothetical protein